MMWKDSHRLLFPLMLSLLLAGCPDPGALCVEGQARCGEACVDLSSSSSHCGACGVACSSTEVCVEGACHCRSGAMLCEGQCVVTASDPVIVVVKPSTKKKRS